MQELSKDEILKMVVDTQVEYIRNNNIRPEFFLFYDPQAVEDFFQLLDNKIKERLNSEDFIFSLSYNKELDALVMPITIFGDNNEYILDMSDITEYIKKIHG